MTLCRCPHCGGQIELSKVGGVQRTTHRGGSTVFQSSNRSIFKNDAAATMPAGYQSELISPSFLPSRESHVTVPLLRSLITGAFFGIAVGCVTSFLAVMGKASAWYATELGALVGGGTFFIGSFVYWLYITGQYDSLLSRVETVTGLDIDQDGEVGKPEPRTIAVEVQQGKTRQWENLPGDEAALIEFAKGVISGRVTFSENGAGDSGYGVRDFRLLRDVFIKAHWAEWKDPQNRQQGVNLRQSGQVILAKIAETPTDGSGPTGMTNQTIDRGTNRGSLT